MTSMTRLCPMALLLLAACTPTTNVAVRPMPSTADESPRMPFHDAYEEGKSQLRADHVGLALVMFQRALAIDPRSVAALNAVGAAYDELHLPDQATPYYLKALAIEPRSADTLNNMGLSALLSGQPDVARQLLHRANSLAPGNTVIKTNMVRVDQFSGGVLSTPFNESPSARPRIERIGLRGYRLHIPGKAIAESPSLAGPLDGQQHLRSNVPPANGYH